MTTMCVLVASQATWPVMSNSSDHECCKYLNASTENFVYSNILECCRDEVVQQSNGGV